jgi:hypothetical protein
VPAAPIRLPRIAASTVPVVAATIAGRCERNVSGLASGLLFRFSDVAGHDFRGQVMARRAGRCGKVQATRLSRSRAMTRITLC